MKILIVEDEIKLATFIKKGLEEYGMEAEIALDGTIGLKKALTQQHATIILDVNLPYSNGFDLCKTIRAEGIETPIIMLTAMGTTEDKLTGFDAGADDYLVKPFEFMELVARIRSLHKRSHAHLNINKILKVSDLEMNLDEKTVKRDSKKITLTARELALLEFFMKNKGKALTRSDIAEKVWDISFDTGTNVIDVYVNSLRKKIDKDFSPKLIHTLTGIGYIMKENES